MPDPKKPKRDAEVQKPSPVPPGTNPKHKPARDTRDDPAPNPNGGGDMPDTSTREEVEKIRPNVKR